MEVEESAGSQAKIGISADTYPARSGPGSDLHFLTVSDFDKRSKSLRGL
jgi:hypothetical protein